MFMLKTLIRASLTAAACSQVWAVVVYAENREHIAVPAGDLVLALETLVRQTDINLLYQAEEIRGLTTRGVNEEVTPREAVEKLLQGTALRVRVDAATGAMMISRVNSSSVNTGQLAAGRKVASSTSARARPEPRAADAERESLEEVVVTGYARSLEQAAEQKRGKVNVTDAVFAEDMGKFPDTNLAESLQRVPGVQIERDETGEGTSVNIRGLGSAFTTLTLANAPIQTANEGTVGGVATGRGLELDLFPTELFRQLTVAKTPTASQIEGGIAANVDLRPIRPFDYRSWHGSAYIRGNYQETKRAVEPRGGVFATNTWDTQIGALGLLGGFVHSSREYRSDTLNTIGQTTFSLGSRCPADEPGCNSLVFGGNAGNPTFGYGGSARIPATVPDNVGFGLVPGTELVPCGAGGTSGLSCQQLSYTAIPRLVRAETLSGERSRNTGILTAQYRANPALQFHADVIYSEGEQNFDQHSFMLATRSTSNNIPIDFEVNDRHVLTHGTFANAQFIAESRRYDREYDFQNVDLGFEWRLDPTFSFDGQVNWNESHFHQNAPIYHLRPPRGRGFAATYDYREGANAPTLSLNFDPNEPQLGWEWIQMTINPLQRTSRQTGARLNGAADLGWASVSAGISYDKFYRNITSWNFSTCATANNGTCSGISLAYPGASRSIPNAQLGGYMKRWDLGELFSTAPFNVGLNSGWAIPDMDRIAPVVGIDYFSNLDPFLIGAAEPRILREDTQAAYVQLDGEHMVWGKELRTNAGVRFFRTGQTISGIVNDPARGREIQTFANTYDEYLPSVNAALEIATDVVIRGAASRTMTRPAPGDLAPGQSLSFNGDQLTRGNPQLRPYFSSNLDVGVEWYFDQRGMLALTLWQKRVDGFTIVRNRLQRFGELGIPVGNLAQVTLDSLTALGGGDPANALVNVATRENSDEVVTLRGLELSWLQPLNSIARGLGFNANYTRIRQRSSNGVPPSPGFTGLGSAVVGLSPSTYNVALYFERNGFEARTSYNYRDPYIALLGPQNNFPGDIYRARTRSLDASVSVPIARRVRLSADATNLLNHSSLSYVNRDKSLPWSGSAPGRSYQLGIQASF
jgi:TonB-dependent receptor